MRALIASQAMLSVVILASCGGRSGDNSVAGTVPVNASQTAADATATVEKPWTCDTTADCGTSSPKSETASLPPAQLDHVAPTIASFSASTSTLTTAGAVTLSATVSDDASGVSKTGVLLERKHCTNRNRDIASLPDLLVVHDG